MIYKRPDSANWWMAFTDADGVPTRRSCETSDRKEALALYQATCAQVWREKHMGITGPRTVRQVLRPYLHNARRVQRSYESTLFRVQTLTRELGDETVVNKLTGQDIRNYSERRLAQGAKPATVNRELAALSAAINYCVRELEWQIPNPVTGRKLREPEGRVRWLTRAEFELLCRTARQQRNGERLEDFLRLAVATGARKEELLGLELRRVDLEHRRILLEQDHTKGDRRRTIPLNEMAVAAIRRRLAWRAERWPDSAWLFTSDNGDRMKSIRNGFESACERAGISNFTIHDLRHTCAAWLVSAGVPLIEVRDLLGHASIEHTEIYAHLAPSRVREAVEVLDVVLQPLANVRSLDEARQSRFTF